MYYDDTTCSRSSSASTQCMQKGVGDMGKAITSNLMSSDLSPVHRLKCK